MKSEAYKWIPAGLAVGFVGVGAQPPLPHGPETCLQPYVWREAFAGDHVCVTVATRTQTRNDNAQAGARRNPGGGSYGPDTCRQGYVWREARPDDHVCVPPATRAQAAQDNSQARILRAPDPRVGEAECQRYARRAIRQVMNKNSSVPWHPACRTTDSARWSDVFDAHYRWCFTAPFDWLLAEERARDEHLKRCGATEICPNC